MQSRGQCKFFAQGTCFKGEFCDFAHDLKMKSRTKACKYFQRGACSFGSRCKFEHAKTSRMESPASSSSHAHGTSSHSPVRIGLAQNPSVSVVVSDQTKENITPERIICPLAVDGKCPHGESCSDIHGDLCATCGKYCLHPTKLGDREKHVKECEKKKALERSQEIECSVCLERVLSKTAVGQRKFGLLSECDHAFCVSCIRKWRSVSSSLELDVNSDSKACPVCRKLSNYVIPSVMWYASKEEKQEIIDKYKAKLKSIHCRYFDFGNGCCLRGTSCFYKHEVKPGSSRRNRSSNTNFNQSSRQYMGVWNGNDDPFMYEDFTDMADMDEMLEMFHGLSFCDDEETGDDGGPEDPLDLFSSFKKAYKLQLMLTGDYEEEDFLEPWQKEFMYSQLGYDMDDDFDFDYDDYGFGDISEDEC